MQAAEERYRKCLASSSLFKADTTQDRAPPSSMVSTVTGKPITKPEIRSVQYWCTNLRSVVRFESAIEDALVKHPVHIIEIGPHSALKPYILEVRNHLGLKDEDVIYSPVLLKGETCTDTVPDALSRLYLLGQKISLESLNDIQDGGIIDLPPYPWIYEKSLCYEPRVSKDFRNRVHPRHELLGSRHIGCNTETRFWKNKLELEQVQWLQDHKIGQSIVFPGAAYLVMAMEALSQIASYLPQGTTIIAFRQVRIINALQLNFAAPIELFTELRPDSNAITHGNSENTQSWWMFKVSSCVRSEITVHARGLIRVDDSQKYSGPTIRELATPLLESNRSNIWYQRLASVGLNFGPTFQQLTEISNDFLRRSCKVMSSLKLFKSQVPSSRYIIHPVTFDALFQTAIIASTAGNGEKLQAKIPIAIDNMAVRMLPLETHSSAKAWAVSRPSGFETVRVDAQLRIGNNEPMIDVENLRLYPHHVNHASQQSLQSSAPLLTVKWRPDVLMTNSLHQKQPISNGSIQGPVQTDNAFLSMRVLQVLKILLFKQPVSRLLFLQRERWSGDLSPMARTIRYSLHQLGLASFTFASIKDKRQLNGHEMGMNSTVAEGDPCEWAPQIIDLYKQEFDVVVCTRVSETFIFQSIS